MREGHGYVVYAQWGSIRKLTLTSPCLLQFADRELSHKIAKVKA
jgi:hypothetical protein